ncbi:MAG: hypothetical protein LBW85_01405 [Deltaproteobacteria bacterium]|jgi:hypothetical protein|nr:hypothetical protein [Deltaproteobacteria bacterium]
MTDGLKGIDAVTPDMFLMITDAVYMEDEAADGREVVKLLKTALRIWTELHAMMDALVAGTEPDTPDRAMAGGTADFLAAHRERVARRLAMFQAEGLPEGD